jgi:type 1 glutamine amidotransferase
LQGDRGKVTALATSDESVGESVSAEPVIWACERGKGRVVASTLGHFDWTFDDPFFRTILLRGMAWAAGEPPVRFDHLVLRGIPLKE